MIELIAIWKLVGICILIVFAGWITRPSTTEKPKQKSVFEKLCDELQEKYPYMSRDEIEARIKKTLRIK